MLKTSAHSTSSSATLETSYLPQRIDELIAKKIRGAGQGLTPVLCIGVGNRSETEAGKTEEVCARQIDAVLKTQGAAAFEGAVIAYEPVWAIGTGKSPAPAPGTGCSQFIRDHIAKS